MKKKKIKKKHYYEVGIPVREIWVMLVEATSLKEARKKVTNGEFVSQICSLEGNKGWIKKVDTERNKHSLWTRARKEINAIFEGGK